MNCIEWYEKFENVSFQSKLRKKKKTKNIRFSVQGIPIVAGLAPNGPSAPKQRLVHLDLKGAPPKVSKSSVENQFRLRFSQFQFLHSLL